MADFGKEEGIDYLVSDLQETPAIEDYLNISSDSASYKTTEGDDPVGQYPPSVRLLYFYHPDYLGNVEYITDMDGLPYQYFSYTPWGEEFKSDIVTPNSWDSPYRFNGKELDEETGLYYYGARYYNPSTSVWLSVDALADKYPNLSSYCFTENNPLVYIDPDGRSTWVVDNEDGTFTVVGGDVNDGDKNIYVVTKDGEGGFNTQFLSIGESMTTHSFADENENIVEGAIIDLSDQKGADFVDDIKENTPTVTEYILDWQEYDFKGGGNTSKVDRYKGYQLSDGTIASARDIGNYSAGYVASKNGFPLSAARVAFERLQATDNLRNMSNFFGDGTEGVNSVLSQNLGWLDGYKERLSKRTGKNYD